MPEPIVSVASNSCEYDPTYDVSSPPPLAASESAPASNANPPPAPREPGVELLVSKHPPAGSAGQCTTEKAALLVASGALIRSAGALVVTAPTVIGEIPAITAFIASTIAVGATAAMYLNCKDDTNRSKPK